MLLATERVGDLRVSLNRWLLRRAGGGCDGKLRTVVEYAAATTALPLNRVVPRQLNIEVG